MAPESRRRDEDDSDYDENADEDFAPTTAAGEDDVSSSSDDEDAPANAPKKRKAKVTFEDEGLASGDEVTIKERKSKKRKVDKEDEESGGEGGVVRTRAQRAVEKEQKKMRKAQEKGEVTVDVDALWAVLSALPIGRPARPLVSTTDTATTADDDDKDNRDNSKTSEKLVKIRRRIVFAGEITEVEEEVSASCAAAQQYLALHPEGSNRPSSTPTTTLHRPFRRPSSFEPNLMAAIRGVPPEKLRPRAPSRTDVLLATQRLEDERKKKAEKMSTVQKSALDWRGFVRKEGIEVEMEEYGKSKRGFLAREEFLDRVAGKKEEGRRDARLKA
ncbi:swr complex subunit [Oleoguttula sp. CCFEE 5521]